LIRCSNISFSFGGEDGAPVLDAIDLEIGDGEWVAVTGGNGSGKTTLCRLLAGLLKPSDGAVSVDGEDSYESRRAADGRIPVAYAFQNPDSQFVTTTVARELRFGMENIGFGADVIEGRFNSAVERFHLTRLLDRNPHALSGGEKQRVMLASIWCLRPRHLVLDEPFAFLDAAGRRSFLEGVRESFHGSGLTIIWATLEPDEVGAAQRVICLEGGRVCFDGSAAAFASAAPDDVLTGPLAPPGAATGAPLAKGAGTAEAAASTGECNRPRFASPRTEVGGVVIESRGAVFTHGGPFELRLGDFTARRGEWIGIVGPSGAGKTTMLHACSGLMPPRDGALVLFGKRIAASRDFPAGRVAVLFQAPEEGFFSPTVRDEVGYGHRSFHGAAGLDRAVDGALAAVGLDPAQYGGRNPFRLSQGEKRLVAVASLLVLNAELLLLDEPTLFLDGSGRRLLGAALAGLVDAGATTFIASHESRFVGRFAKRRIGLAEGRIVEAPRPRPDFP
jgi:energy-coupling factor transport system ATP-binding protein